MLVHEDLVEDKDTGGSVMGRISAVLYMAFV